MSETHISPVVFVSYSRTDNALVTRLKADLDTQGISIWMDREGILPGTSDWEEALRAAIREARAVLLVASPSARSSRYVKDELRIAEMYQRPVYPFWIAGTQWMDSVPLGWGGTQYIDGREGRYETALHDIIEALKGVPSAPTKDAEPHETTRDVEPRNPYKGLRAFTNADTLDFFGRDTFIKELMEALKEVLTKEQRGVQSERLLALVGASGSGKSSVVMAGLLPCLRNGGLPESREWVYLDPIATALAKRQGAQGTHVVLVVDQFEELFTLTTSEEERRRFIDLLVTAITESRSPVILILTLRADFCDRPMHYPELYRLIDIHHCSVLPMNLKDLRAVIEQPATLPDVQLTFEGDLVGDLLFEVQGQVGALPLLEFTLDQLFQQRNDHCLTLQAYQQMGGVKGALAKHAESTYAALPSEEHRRVARALFLRLIDPGETEQDTTRRRAALSELSLPDAKQTAIMRETADTFILARLLTTNEVAGITTVEVSHEALIREWTRLSDWLRGGREDIHLQQLISEDVSEWEQHGKPRDRLYRGSQLVDANAWAARNMPSGKEMAFLQAGAAHQKRTRASVTASVSALVLLLVLIIGLVAQIVLSRQPDPTHVTTLNYNGPGSLRQAIDLAHDGSTITFDKRLPKGTIMLSGNLNIGKSLTIIGPGASMLTISSGSRGYSIQVDSGATVTIKDLAFKDSTIKYEHPNSFTSFITNNGTLTLRSCIVSGNISVGSNSSGSGSGSGGGISNYGTLTLTNSTVSHNTASGGSYAQQNGYSGSGGNGGGIVNGGTLTLTNSIVSYNIAAAGIGATNDNSNAGGIGGGISNYGTLTLTNSIVSHNTAFGAVNSKSNVSSSGGGSGGGISNNGTLTLTNSAISDNTASGGIGVGVGGIGGGISNSGSFSPSGVIVKITNSTISGNTASGSSSKSGGCGGGISNESSTLTLIGSTVSGNTTSGGSVGDDNPNSTNFNTNCNPYGYGSSIGSGGGGIANFGSSNGSSSGNYSYGTLTLINSTIAGNTSASSGGGIIDWSSKTTIIFCTIYGNTAANGRGIAAETSYTYDYSGNGQPIPKPIPSHVQMRNSIVAGDHAHTGSDIAGALTSDGYNLIQDISGATFASNKQHSTDIPVKDFTKVFAVNATLQDDRGSTKTYALLPGTDDPALDKIPLAVCHFNSITTDQRGVRRPDGNETACDIGAYEYAD